MTSPCLTVGYVPKKDASITLRVDAERLPALDKKVRALGIALSARDTTGYSELVRRALELLLAQGEDGLGPLSTAEQDIIRQHRELRTVNRALDEVLTAAVPVVGTDDAATESLFQFLRVLGRARGWEVTKDRRGRVSVGPATETAPLRRSGQR
jgi:hypothetical protein